MARAIESGVPPRGPQPVRRRRRRSRPPTTSNASCCRFAGDGVEERTAEQTAVAMVAAARGFHKREDKPFWWAHFDRVNNPVDEWADNSDVFIAERAEIVADWHQPPRARKPQRHVRLIGDIANGDLGRRACTRCTTRPHPPASPTTRTGARSARSTVVGVRQPRGAHRGRHRREAAQGRRRLRPTAVRPDPGTADQHQATAGVDRRDRGRRRATGLPALPADAVTDILLRRAPRTISGGPLPRTGSIADDITAALLDLDSSYLAVHGPPGTGKTFTSAGSSQRLVNEHGWRVGVVAQSHAVVENLFCDVIAAGVDGARVGQEAQHRQHGLDRHHQPGVRRLHRRPRRLRRRRHGVGLRQRQQDSAPGSLDLLVVEEAGQYSLANTIAVAPSARNLMLLGDPQQLPQVSQGTHPEPVNESALGWLVEGHPVLPPDRGYFLDLLLPHAPRGVRPGVPAVLRRAAALPRGRQRRPPPRRRDARRAAC